VFNNVRYSQLEYSPTFRSQYGFVLNETTPGLGTTGCTFINPVVEGTYDAGIYIINGGGNLFLGGTSEANGRGIKIDSGGSSNVFDDIFMEANTRAIGSPLSSAAALAVTSITSAATTATATVSVAHGYATDDFVTIAGATQTEYNGTYRITVTGATTFTYTFAGSGTTPATGTITVQRSSDILVAGNDNTFRNCYSAGSARVTGDRCVFEGGLYVTFYIDSSANLTKLSNQLVQGTLTDSGTNTIDIGRTTLTVAADNKFAADLNATGGFRVNLSGWAQTTTVAASQTNVALTDTVAPRGRLVGPRAGSVTGISLMVSTARSAGTLTAQVQLSTNAGVSWTSISGCSVTLNTNVRRASATFTKDLYAFALTDALRVVVTTDGSWAPTANNLDVSVEVET
jgi:hypothetical protein